jgi:hypothetical protein
MSRRLVVWCEDKAHWNACRGLSRTYVLAEAPDWVREAPEQFENYVGRWERLPETPPASGFRPLARFGQGLANTVFRKVLIGLAMTTPPDVVVLAQDEDHDEKRRADLDAAASRSWPFGVVRMMPAPETEAWQIALSDKDDEHLAREMNFSPRREPHRLTSTVRHDPRDAKRVAERLGLEEWDFDAWAEISADRLRKTAAACTETGLGVFLDDLRTHLITPLSYQRSP